MILTLGQAGAAGVKVAGRLFFKGKRPGWGEGHVQAQVRWTHLGLPRMSENMARAVKVQSS